MLLGYLLLVIKYPKVGRGSLYSKLQNDLATILHKQMAVA